MRSIAVLSTTSELFPFKESVEACWGALQCYPLFSRVAVADWWIERVEVKRPADIIEYFGCEENPKEQIRVLPEKLKGVDMCCVIEIFNNDRSGIEWMPPHVLGRSGTFFMDMAAKEIRHAIIGEYLR